MATGEVIKKNMWGVVVVVLSAVFCHGVEAQPQVPCYFIFGDSLVDNGNNNQLPSLARANYLPFGIDFPQGPTGRFSNGKTAADVISELLGFSSYIPPCANASGQDILRGVNYASAAAGIREDTGKELGARISFSGQVRNYQNAVQQIASILGDENAAADYLRKCIYSVGMGSNDYLNDYFVPQIYSSSYQYTPDQYAQVLIQQYAQQLMIMYNYGSRKFTLFGVGQIGCTPHALANSPDGRTCNQRYNSANQIFNNRLKALVDQLNSNHTDAKFIFVSPYSIFEDIIANPLSFGFRVANVGCCGVGKNRAQITCLPLQIPCPNRREYFFWDAYHPTEAVNTIFGRRAYSAQRPSDAYPFDVRRFAQLQFMYDFEELGFPLFLVVFLYVILFSRTWC